MKNNAKKRESYIISLLEKKNRVHVDELCTILGSAPSTIRKQLAEMEKKQLLIRTHGGAVSFDFERDETIDTKNRLNSDEKRWIAKKSRSLINDGDSLILGSGTTVFELCRSLLDLKDSVIYTNSMLVANYLSSNENLEIHLCGGLLRGRTGSIVGYEATKFFSSVRAAKAFISPDAVTLDGQALSSNISVAQVENRMLMSAKERYILGDSSKIGKTSIFPIVALNQCDCLITTSGIRQAVLNDLGKSISIQIPH